MTIPASEQYTEIVVESIDCSKELAEKLSEDICDSKDEHVHLTLPEAQCIASQLNMDAKLINDLLTEHNTTMVRVNELIDEGNNKKKKWRH